MEYLDIEEVTSRKAAIRAAFDSLMDIKPLVSRPKSNQWQFFKSCGEKLLGEQKDSGRSNMVKEWSKQQNAQYKYEVESKLKRFYQRPGKQLPYVFCLVHCDNLEQYGLSSDSYPVYSSYSLLVRDAGASYHNTQSRRELIEYLEKIVADGINAEFNYYKSLPNGNETELYESFVKDSPAVYEILTVGEGIAARGWRLTNRLNPSTCRAISVVVNRIEKNEAEVATREYWYLRWWDNRKKKYTYPYRETNRQIYILNKRKNEWKIYQNIRPMPRSSQPFRWSRRQKGGI